MKNKIILAGLLFIALCSCVTQKNISETYSKGGPTIFKNQMK